MLGHPGQQRLVLGQVERTPGQHRSQAGGTLNNHACVAGASDLDGGGAEPFKCYGQRFGDAHIIVDDEDQRACGWVSHAAVYVRRGSPRSFGGLGAEFVSRALQRGVLLAPPRRVRFVAVVLGPRKVAVEVLDPDIGRS